MVTRFPADEPEVFHAARCDHHNAALLKRIARDARLTEAGSPGLERAAQARSGEQRGEPSPHAKRVV